MQNISIGNLLSLGNVATYGNQNQRRNNNPIGSNFDTYMPSMGIGSEYSEQSTAYLDLQEIYQARNRYNAVYNVPKQELEDITTSSNYEKMVDDLTGVTYYKNKTSLEIQMTGEDFTKFREFFVNEPGGWMMHHMKLSGKMREDENFRIVISDSNPALGHVNDGIFIIDKKNNVCIAYENIGDANKFFGELDEYLFGNDKKLNLDSFKEFMNQYNNGNTQVKFSTENAINSTENESSSEIITLADGSRALVITISFGGSEIKLSLKISEPDKNMNEHKDNDESRSESIGNEGNVPYNIKSQSILDNTDIISSMS